MQNALKPFSGSSFNRVVRNPHAEPDPSTSRVRGNLGRPCQIAFVSGRLRWAWAVLYYPRSKCPRSVLSSLFPERSAAVVVAGASSDEPSNFPPRICKYTTDSCLLTWLRMNDLSPNECKLSKAIMGGPVSPFRLIVTYRLRTTCPLRGFLDRSMQFLYPFHFEL